ncbi:xanthine dehydrogenase accessory protein XdhC [Pikeienuella piscinae]|uniref:Xanthine dehydrogenase accessory protein XdhC n=1 Tax=Pikeienuella piscinae TaxID=2748098 RepID=A0A7M3T6X4_9RHOB|nr:xanthine dehydrogenase accessory protein XdhC [Pikeienuella piscinae]
MADLLARGAPAVLIRIESVAGSAPREAGAAMVVSAQGSTGTIGGGALEHMAIGLAREMLSDGAREREIDQPLGPEIGQCCGGRVRLRLRRADAATLDALAAAEAALTRPEALIFGAGHVGAALARALAPLPLSLRVIDERGPLLAPLSAFGRTVETALPEAEISAAPPGAAYVILTHDHGLDFLIAEAALARADAAYIGMIGSATKRATLVSRLSRAGGPPADRLVCPIGAAGPKDRRPSIIAAATAAEIAAALF